MHHNFPCLAFFELQMAEKTDLLKSLDLERANSKKEKQRFDRVAASPLPAIEGSTTDGSGRNKPLSTDQNE